MACAVFLRGQKLPAVSSSAQQNRLLKNNAFSTVFGTGGNEAGTFTLNRYMWGAVEANRCIFFTNYSHKAHAVASIKERRPPLFTKKADDIYMKAP